TPHHPASYRLEGSSFCQTQGSPDRWQGCLTTRAQAMGGLARKIELDTQIFPFEEAPPWPRSQRYLPHALVCEELIKQWNITLDEASILLHNAGLYLRNRGQYGEAAPFLQYALAIKEKMYGRDDPNTNPFSTTWHSSTGTRASTPRPRPSTSAPWLSEKRCSALTTPRQRARSTTWPTSTVNRPRSEERRVG